jgi:hypothetical protein
MCRARDKKSLKPFSAARECEYRKRRAWRTWEVRMSVGVGVEGEGCKNGREMALGASGSGSGTDVALEGSGMSDGKSSS